MMSTDAADVVAIALTGGTLPAPDDLGASSLTGDATSDLIAWLAAAGWDAGRLMQHRDETLAAGRVWPHRVSAAVRGNLGAAQAAALIRGVVAELGLDHGVTTVRRRIQADDADRRLIAELPPHHGRVG